LATEERKRGRGGPSSSQGVALRHASAHGIAQYRIAQRRTTQHGIARRGTAKRSIT
jgi:hypothetical protein